MPKPILYGPDGVTPVESGQHFGRITLREPLTLPLRQAEILRDMTLWQMERHLEPLLVCKTCYMKYQTEDGRPGSATHKDAWAIVMAITAKGQLQMSCACSQWTTDHPITFAKDSVAPTTAESVAVVGKRQRPLGTRDARLLEAWKIIMDLNGWAEMLFCTDCFSSGRDNICKCLTIPGKSITIDCACTDRHWQGVTK